MQKKKQKTVLLLVEDNYDDVDLLCEILNSYEKHIATDGKKALEIAFGEPRIDLIILDVLIPKINGFEVCRKLKNNDKTKDIPIIILTSLDEESDRNKVFECGAVDYIMKPILGREVLAKVITHLKLFGLSQELTQEKAILENKVEKRTESLRIEKEEVERVNRFKSHFLSLISHELRTPMAGILGFSEILSSEVKNEVHKEYSKIIYESANRLKETIESILDLSRITSLETKMRIETVDIIGLIKFIASERSDEIQRKNLQLSINANDEEINIVSDEKFLRTVFENLLSNSIKYTNKGGISISINRNSVKKNIKVTITDTGVGIPEEKLELIFQEFRQGDEGMHRKYEGIGLGLTITKRYLEHLKGQITVKSRKKEGSTFTVILPEKLEERKEEVPRVEMEEVIVKTKVKNILLVEDDQINVNVIRLFLRDSYSLEAALRPEEALTYIRENYYDVFLVDINLRHEITGIHIAKEIRSNPKFKYTPVIALTAFAEESDKALFLKSGFTHFLAKPFTKKGLLELIESVSE